jgi:peptide/nickel transport system permease protein/oligopeptide transport system permease protein
MVIALTVILIFGFVAIAPGAITSYDLYDCPLERSRQAPTSDHWFGTDVQGCDYYTRTVYGARASMAVGLIVVGVAALVGVVFGSVAAYRGGLVDSVISRLADIWFAIPPILGAVAVLSLLGDRGLTQVAVVLILFTFAPMVRLMRAQVLTVREQEYVDSARALGAGTWRILRSYIVPNAIGPLLAYATIVVGVVMIAEAAMTFLGVGLQPPSVSWGLMITQARGYILTQPYLLIFPGLALTIVVLAFVVLGDGLRALLDPRSR